MIYPHITFSGDGIALIDDTGISVQRVMATLVACAQRRNPRGLTARSLRLTEGQVSAAEAFARDCWLTPAWFAALLPPREQLMDPCSNPRSHVDAEVRYMLERGENGLELPWCLFAYVNAGFSELMPWAAKLAAERERGGLLFGVGFLVNTDNSTRWWHALTDQLPCLFTLDARLRFDPHPGVPKSTNNRPQTLIADRAFIEACHPDMFNHGEFYERAARPTRAA